MLIQHTSSAHLHTPSGNFLLSQLLHVPSIAQKLVICLLVLSKIILCFLNFTQLVFLWRIHTLRRSYFGVLLETSCMSYMQLPWPHLLPRSHLKFLLVNAHPLITSIYDLVNLHLGLQTLSYGIFIFLLLHTNLSNHVQLVSKQKPMLSHIPSPPLGPIMLLNYYF